MDMHTLKSRSTHARHLNGHRAKRHPSLNSKLKNMYSYSLKTVKKKPYQATGALLGFLAVSSLVFWYRLLK